MARVDDRTKARRQRFLEQCAEILEENSSKYTTDEMIKIHNLLDSLLVDWNLDITSIKIKVEDLNRIGKT
jgi:hypothetical protein